LAFPGLKVPLLLLEISLIADFVPIEVGLFRFLDFIKVPNQQLVSILAGSEAHLLFNQSTIPVLVEIFVWTEEPLVQLRGLLPSVDLVEIQNFASFVGISYTEAASHAFRVEVRGGQILLSLRYKKVTLFLIVLLPQVEGT